MTQHKNCVMQLRIQPIGFGILRFSFKLRFVNILNILFWQVVIHWCYECDSESCGTGGQHGASVCHWWVWWCQQPVHGWGIQPRTRFLGVYHIHVCTRGGRWCRCHPSSMSIRDSGMWVWVPCSSWESQGGVCSWMWCPHELSMCVCQAVWAIKGCAWWPGLQGSFSRDVAEQCMQ